jgi:hydrogenase-4 component E
MFTLSTLLELVLLLNFFVLGASRLRTAVNLVAVQGMLLGAAPLWLEHGSRVVLLSLGTIAVKGVLIPRLLLYAMRDLSIGPEVRPAGGFIASLLLGAAGTGASLWFGGTLPLHNSEHSAFVVPASLATIFTGFVMLITRSRTISQSLGYLVLENGVFVFSLLLIEAVPALVEIGVLLDLIVAVFVMGIIIQHINRELDPLERQHLSALKE